MRPRLRRSTPAFRLLSWFGELHERATSGQKYLASFGRDMKTLADVLKVHGEDRTAELLDAFFEARRYRVSTDGSGTKVWDLDAQEKARYKAGDADLSVLGFRRVIPRLVEGWNWTVSDITNREPFDKYRAFLAQKES